MSLKPTLLSRMKRGKDLLVILTLSASSLLVFQNCSNGFVAAPLQNRDVVSEDTLVRGKTLYSQHCAACHGPVDSSAKKSRDTASILAAISEVPQMNYLRNLSSQDLELIVVALSEPEPPPVLEGGRQVFACTPGELAKTPMRKLTNREFRGALNLLLDDVSTSLKNDSSLTNLFSILPSDVVTQDRNTSKEQSLLVAQAGVNAQFDVVFRAGELIAGANLGSYPGTSSCLSQTSLTQACHQSFVREFASRAFRRSLSTGDATTLATSLWTAGSSKADQITSTVAAILTMPDFAYKAFDRGTVVNGTVLELNAHELAAKMSFFLTGTPPDSTLRGLADSGQILQAQVLSDEIDRLLARPGAQDMIRRLFRESYGYEIYDSFSYPSSYLNGISTNGLRDAMTSELDSYFVEIVLNRRGSFQDLMTSTVSSVPHASLAAIYGVSSTGNTQLPAERAGFLNRAAMLAKRSGVNATPIKRGLKVLEHVLCDDVGLPPPSAPTSLPNTEGEILSTRARTHRVTETAGTSCVGCHTKMNNLGYPFERFDTLGRRRAMESIFDLNGQLVTQVAINTVSTTYELKQAATTVMDSADLVRELGRSDRAMMCFIKQLKRFESGVSAPASANCQMNQSLSALHANNGTGSIHQAIKALVLSPEFRRWNY